MNETSSTDDLRAAPVDDLDRLLSSFFKGQMRSPWPAAPVTSEPAELVAARSAASEPPRNQPVARDSGTRARFTLAASVALLLGTGWFLSNGFQPGERGPGTPASLATDMLGGGTAGNPKVLEVIRDDKAKNGDPKVAPPKIELP